MYNTSSYSSHKEKSLTHALVILEYPYMIHTYTSTKYNEKNKRNRMGGGTIFAAWAKRQELLKTKKVTAISTLAYILRFSIPPSSACCCMRIVLLYSLLSSYLRTESFTVHSCDSTTTP